MYFNLPDTAPLPKITNCDWTEAATFKFIYFTFTLGFKSVCTLYRERRGGGTGNSLSLESGVDKENNLVNSGSYSEFIA